MKKIIIIITMLLAVAPRTFASVDSSIVYVKKGALPPDILKRFEQSTSNIKTVENIINTVEEFKGKVDPREIGMAVDTISTILSRQANGFASSRVGKYTVFLIMWRVFGDGMTQLILKTIFFITALTMFCVMWRRSFMGRSFVKKVTIHPGKFFPRKEVVEEYNFETTDDLFIKGQSENDFGNSDSPGPGAVAKLISLFFLLISVLMFIFIG